MNKVVDTRDMNTIVDTRDINTIVDTRDVNAIVDTIDVNKIIDARNVNKIVDTRDVKAEIIDIITKFILRVFDLHAMRYSSTSIYDRFNKQEDILF